MSDSGYHEASAEHPMSTVSPEIQALAHHLLAFDEANDHPSDARAKAAAQVVAELRLRLIKLTGVEGFRSLLSRAVALAKAEGPLLDTVQVSADGSLEGLDGIEQTEGAEAAGQAGTVLVARLLELLVAFIGQPLTLHLVRDARRVAPTQGVNLKTEEKP